MPLVEANNENTRLAAEILHRGGLAAFPTETVYGLGGDAFNAAALAKIFELKNRPRFDPLIVHIADVESLGNVIDFSLLDSSARKRLDALAKHFWPGPLTLVLPKGKDIPDLASSGLPSLAVRIPANETARQLIALSTGAVAAPSANPFGYLSPSRAEHVMEMLGEKVEIILDGGPTQIGIESTVLDICHAQPRILRPGGTPQEAIEALIGAVAVGPADKAAAGGMASPGLLKSHYAPGTPLLAHGDTRLMAADKDSACLFFDGASRDNWLASPTGPLPPRVATVAVLSETGNMEEAASRLFEILHELDKSGVKQIHAQLAPETGLGRAINDRLRRAAGNTEINF
jgi:L-threonylcarbamoyladenylate synthase